MTAVLVTPFLTGCISGSTEFAQAGMDDIETVGIQVDGVTHSWPPTAQHGQGVALTALIVLYPAQPVEGGNISQAAGDELVREHEHVSLELVDQPSTILAELQDEHGREIEVIHFLFENGTDQAADTEILACGSTGCGVMETTESFADLREKAEKGAQAVQES